MDWGDSFADGVPCWCEKQMEFQFPSTQSPSDQTAPVRNPSVLMVRREVETGDSLEAQKPARLSFDSKMEDRDQYPKFPRPSHIHCGTQTAVVTQNTQGYIDVILTWRKGAVLCHNQRQKHLYVKPPSRLQLNKARPVLAMSSESFRDSQESRCSTMA